MIGYSEVIYTMAGMLVFSLILLSANRMMHRNTQLQVEGELEKEVIAVAQNIIEESRSVAFDEMTVDGIPPVKTPDHFTAASIFGTKRSDEGTQGEDDTDRTTFDDFDDYDGWGDTITVEDIDYKLSVKVRYADATTYDSTSYKTNFKKIYVKVENKYLTNTSDEPIDYEFTYIRNYYAD
ncbi:hypothetical protein NC796_06875 [Aliifodinibius sp. S!AR15-10]|uniref:hypothetical protein n=1 Tax=Aliifodinibius sp. S!AR15-10 TaxID=2950437 RepID=UPI00285CBD28|nr:hypothetical protein [Aliifodinibius sp. S!AR15-10]MDR8390852.1 hypothetical protein [Aliifodinibius sp. S!AR15-10]